jgi:hypothetical protein
MNDEDTFFIQFFRFGRLRSLESINSIVAIVDYCVHHVIVILEGGEIDGLLRRSTTVRLMKC